jgi:hypothetical protein
MLRLWKGPRIAPDNWRGATVRAQQGSIQEREAKEPIEAALAKSRCWKPEPDYLTQPPTHSADRLDDGLAH